MTHPFHASLLALALLATAHPLSAQTTATAQQPLLTGEAATGDWTTDAPGVRRKLVPADMPAPYATASANANPKVVKRPDGAMPQVPAGFQVNEFSTNVKGPRQLRTAPNGDVFIAESNANRIKVLRDADGDGKAETAEIFADDLKRPFGVTFYPPGDNPTHVYVANTESVVRFAYKAGDLKATGEPEVIVDNLDGGGQLRGGGHWTRDVVFSADGKRMFVSIGSKSNVDEGNEPVEKRRARIFVYTPDGKNEKLYADGIRNPVGLAIEPVTGALWTSVNERDGIGDHLVPDYITSVKEGGFYGWPEFYIGPNEDPRKKGQRPELKDKVIVPDVLVQSHSASLGMHFYTGTSFPKEYQGDAFAAQHGSWNRERRTGYKVIQVPIDEKGQATGEYVDFLTGFVVDKNSVWGRPVGVTQGKDGSLLVSDDGANIIWRVSKK